MKDIYGGKPPPYVVMGRILTAVLVVLPVWIVYSRTRKNKKRKR